MLTRLLGRARNFSIQTNITNSQGDPYSQAPGKILFPSARNFAGVQGTDFLEIYCGDAKHAAHYFSAVFGFRPVAFRGLETGSKDRSSFVLRQNQVTLVLTSALKPGSEISDFVTRHGDGVKYVALAVGDAKQAFEATTSRGAEIAMKPMEISDSLGKVSLSGVKTYGDVVHLFVDKKDYKGVFLPGYETIKGDAKDNSVGLKYIDHLVSNVDWNEMDKWGEFYKRVFGMEQLISFDDKDISTKYTALKSKVMTIETGAVKYPINEPAKGEMKSQIEEFIEFNGGAGVQHVALATDDIIKTVSELRRRGVQFLRVPDTYYETVTDRVGEIKENLAVLKDLGILVDRDDKGYLLQIFTKPLGVRPTLFFEIIQRRGGFSFGKGNFKALFESIEEEQRRRGTL